MTDKTHTEDGVELFPASAEIELDDTEKAGCAAQAEALKGKAVSTIQAALEAIMLDAKRKRVRAEIALKDANAILGEQTVRLLTAEANAAHETDETIMAERDKALAALDAEAAKVGGLRRDVERLRAELAQAVRVRGDTRIEDLTPVV